MSTLTASMFLAPVASPATDPDVQARRIARATLTAKLVRVDAQAAMRVLDLGNTSPSELRTIRRLLQSIDGRCNALLGPVKALDHLRTAAAARVEDVERAGRIQDAISASSGRPMEIRRDDSSSQIGDCDRFGFEKQ